MTNCYDCDTLITSVDECRVLTTSTGVSLVLCLSCTAGRPGDSHKPASLPERSRYELGGESR